MSLSETENSSPASDPPIAVPRTQPSIPQAEGCVTIENKSNEIINVKDVITETLVGRDHLQLLTRQCQNCRIYLFVPPHLFFSLLPSHDPLICVLGRRRSDLHDLNSSQIVKCFLVRVAQASISSLVRTASSLFGVISCAYTPPTTVISMFM
jgi:hypothetical protein